MVSAPGHWGAIELGKHPQSGGFGAPGPLTDSPGTLGRQPGVGGRVALSGADATARAGGEVPGSTKPPGCWTDPS
jgi:hypothetical protein